MRGVLSAARHERDRADPLDLGEAATAVTGGIPNRRAQQASVPEQAAHRHWTHGDGPRGH
eukprot:scaffold1811_cov411-Prasinococcus_capsulatus_cf.AAC.25